MESIDLGESKKVSHAHDLTDWSAADLPHLRSFKWRWAYSTHTRQVRNLVRGRDLTCLDLRCCEGMGENDWRTGLTDTLLEDLACNCPSLTTLRLEGDLRFTDRGILALIEGCKNLKHVHLNLRCIFHRFLGGTRIYLKGSTVDAFEESTGLNFDKCFQPEESVFVDGHCRAVPQV